MKLTTGVFCGTTGSFMMTSQSWTGVRGNSECLASRSDGPDNGELAIDKSGDNQSSGLFEK